MRSAQIAGIFCSVQGEGLYVGSRQAFIRFQGCNLNCNYCDTPEARTAKKECSIELTPGSGNFTHLENPLDSKSVGEVISKYNGIHSVSLTGGEPLLHSEFIRELAVKTPLYLESNMTLPEKAEVVKDRVNYVAGDFKLSDAFDDAINYEAIREATIQSFRVLRETGKRKCFCKIVLQRGSKLDEIIQNVEQISDYISSMVLQPVTVLNRTGTVVSIREIMGTQAKLLDLVGEVRVIPQTHKIWGRYDEARNNRIH
jgi:organic radical activating enzyme